MSLQIWGCYSVADHLASRAFVADVLLYERLVIPVPPANDAAQLKEWKNAGWNPERQEELLEVLGGKAMQVPWTASRRDEWQRRWSTALTAQEIHEVAAGPNPYLVTRMQISEEVGKRAHEQHDVRALAIYADPVRFDSEWQIRKAFPFVGRKRRVLGMSDQDEPEAPKDAVMPPEQAGLARFLVGKFVFPEDQTLADKDLLDRALQFAAAGKLAAWRTEFHGWLDNISKSEISDARIAREMGQLIDAYNRAVRSRKGATIVRQSATLVGSGVGIGAAIWGGPLAYAASAPVSMVGDVVAERIYGEPSTDRVMAGALLAEAGKQFRK
jgi:hypothetical protein